MVFALAMQHTSAQRSNTDDDALLTDVRRTRAARGRAISMWDAFTTSAQREAPRRRALLDALDRQRARLAADRHLDVVVLHLAAQRGAERRARRHHLHCAGRERGPAAARRDEVAVLVVVVVAHRDQRAARDLRAVRPRAHAHLLDVGEAGAQLLDAQRLPARDVRLLDRARVLVALRL